MCEGVWIHISSMIEWSIMQRTLQSYRTVAISTSPFFADRSGGCQRPGEAGNWTWEHQAALAMRTWSWELSEVLHSQVSPEVESWSSPLGWDWWVLWGGEHLPHRLIFASWWTTPSCCSVIGHCKLLGKYSCRTLVLQYLPINFFSMVFFSPTTLTQLYFI